MGILDNIKNWFGKTKDQVEQTAEDLMNSESVKESIGKAKETIESGLEKAEDFGEAIMDKTGSVISDLKTKGQETMEDIKSNEGIQNALDKTKKSLSDAADKLEDFGEKTAAQAGDLVDRIKDKGEETIESLKSNPTIKSTISTAKEKYDQVEDKIEEIGEQVKEKLNINDNDDSINEEE